MGEKLSGGLDRSRAPNNCRGRHCYLIARQADGKERYVRRHFLTESNAQFLVIWGDSDEYDLTRCDPAAPRRGVRSLHCLSRICWEVLRSRLYCHISGASKPGRIDVVGHTRQEAMRDKGYDPCHYGE
jgi:hypothetical protein